MNFRAASIGHSIPKFNSQFLRFLIVGCWNAFFSLTIFYCLIYSLGEKNYQFSLFISFICSTVQSYLMQKRFVWNSLKMDFRQFFHFCLVCTLQYFINVVLMYGAVSLLKFSAKEAQIPVSFTIALLSYLYFKTRVFIFSVGSGYEEIRTLASRRLRLSRKSF
jgi:putative flippase GtrA